MRTNSLLILFGLPGVGKTYVGGFLQQYFGYHFHDGDWDIPPAMKRALAQQEPITDALRDEFFRTILTRLKQLQSDHPRLVLAQTYIKEKYRQEVLHHFPHAQFVLVQAPDEVREQRLQARNDYPLPLAYARTMVEHFDPPRIDHFVIDNTHEGDSVIRVQFKRFGEDS